MLPSAKAPTAVPKSKRQCSAFAHPTMTVIAELLDLLVGHQQEADRHVEAERLGGLEVYGHLEFDRQLNG